MSQHTDSCRTIMDFKDGSEADQWIVVSDSVMGGLSRGQIRVSEDSCLIFSGFLSLENNGGFSSTRTQPRDFSLGDFLGMRIRVKGDGRLYQFRLRLDDDFDGVAFTQEFQTAEDAWLEIDLPFASFVPTYRGRVLRNVGPLVASDIRQLGFLIADKTAGPFNLKVDRIAGYK